jgi:hypothetical protein
MFAGRATQLGRDNDMLADIVDVTQNVIVPEAENDPAIQFQTARSCEICRGGAVIGVLGAIDLDNQLFLRAGEIDYITSDRELPSETKPHQPMRAKLIPEFELGFSHRTTHRFGVAAIG